MKVVIRIGGLDVEFSDAKPTKPGALYVLCPAYPTEPRLEELFEFNGKLCITIVTRPKPVSELRGWLFSAPLVPATEVEKAYAEGFRAGSRVGSDLNPWYKSRARRVVEGAE